MAEQSTLASSWTRHLPPGVDPATVDLVERVSLPAVWAANWRAAPDREVVHDPDAGWVTGGELLARSAHVAGRLAAAGLRTGDHVLLSGGSSADFVVTHCAALRMGLVVVPVNSAYTKRELAAIMADAKPRGAILEAPRLRAWAHELAPDIVATGIDVDLPDGEAPALDAMTASDPALLPYTSGTTGTPKGALLSHGNLLASAEATRIAWRRGPDDRLILCLPLFHVHGLGVGLHGVLLSGGSAILQPSFDPDAVLTAAAADATLFFGVPTMYARLAEAPGAERLGALRLCCSGSAPLSADLHRAIGERCGQTILERYGMTETLMLVSNPYDGERRPGTVGFPLPGVELRLHEPSNEILVRGPAVFGGYFNRPEANAEAFDADGWFATGDIGHVDDDGYVSIVGRAKELIITGGFNVYPREVEDVLRAHSSVGDVAIVGTPSDEWGETVTAYVETEDPDFDPDALLAYAADQLVAYKRPRLIHRVDALPRNRLGKVLRHELEPPA
jgi:malonyl-CoA/methylmalonyl-CoA synthetase